MISPEKKVEYRIIVIDDNPAIHEDFRKILTPSSESDAALEDMESLLFGEESRKDTENRFELVSAYQGQEGLEKVVRAQEEGRPFSLAFVDGRMPPGWDGVETINRLWQECPELQVVLCTAYADYSWQEIQEALGKNDSLLILKKPFDNVEVLQLAQALTRKWELNREIQGRLNKLAFYDHLTGLPNRVLFLDRLESALSLSQRHQHAGALLFIDLDDFKRINDTLGHTVGDEVLKVMAERIAESLRITDTVSRAPVDETAARLGGDEFTIILPEISHHDQAAMIARRIGEHLAEPITIGGQRLLITASIGISIFPDDGVDVETLLKNADLAMYCSKNTDQGDFKYYQDSMNAAALRRLTIENQLRRAVSFGELQLHYQPQVELSSGNAVGLEALLRWESSELGNVPPCNFIPIAEESGLIVALGEWVLRTACGQVQKWRESGLHIERVAVNVSVKQFMHPDFVGMVERILQETGLPPHCLEIEITETLLARDTSNISELLEQLRALSISIAVDDFGTGYSSFSRLKEIPIDCLKIDRLFVNGIEEGANNQAIICAIMAMAEGMGLRVIAEGVEKQQQIDFLSDKHCQEAQGYFFRPPLPAADIEQFLRRNNTQ